MTVDDVLSRTTEQALQSVRHRLEAMLIKRYGSIGNAVGQARAIVGGSSNDPVN